jgi:hypothetical protein
VLAAALVVATLLAATAATYAVLTRRDPATPTAADYSRAASPPPEPTASVVPVTPPSAPAPSFPPGPSPTARPGPSPSGDTEEAQLSQLAAVLGRSATARAALGATTRAVADCTIPAAQALRRISGVIGDRQRQLAQVRLAQVSQIPDGGRLRRTFENALRYSLAADNEFTDWMRDVERTGQCPVPTLADSSYLAGITDSSLAARAKEDLLLQWNPLAVVFGLPGFSPGQI